jgi:hypothetical protein
MNLPDHLEQLRRQAFVGRLLEKLSGDKIYYFRSRSTGVRRNTGVFAASEAEARKKLRRPSPDDAEVYAVRTPNPGEGDHGWSRIRADGRGPDSSRFGRGRGFGPPRT